MDVRAITQPATGSVIEAISWILEHCQVSRFDIAAAYITTNGVEELIFTLRSGLGDSWPDVEKRWLTSFDYLRTTPLALNAILAAPKSKLRIHNSLVLNNKGCVPSVPFHPKLFVFTGSNARYVLAGSGNVSKSGLTRGHEAGIIVGLSNPPPAAAAQSASCLDAFDTWFEGLWGPASNATPALLHRYQKLYESQPNLRNPTPTEDDTSPEETKRGQLTPVELRKLRACPNLWIEADRNITPNRGVSLPGNQLMMKRLTRVFFGFPPDEVPRDTSIGRVHIAYNGYDPHDCSLTFSNNYMDKLTLPIPGVNGPVKYDSENLLFQRVGLGLFSLTLGTNAEKTQWRRRSREIDANFKMSGGRAWGVF